MFANGVKIGTVEWTTSYNSNTRIIFGSLTTYDSYYIHEYIDEIRFSDVARYTDSFDVPNAPYGQAVADNRTLTELIEDLEEEKQLKVLPTNIRNQITILGVTGNLIPGVDTSDANAIASDIVQDKTAYVNGEKLTGALTMFNYSFGDLAEQGYDLSGKSEEDPFVLTVDADGLMTAIKMPDRLSLESQSYFPYSISNLDIAEEANITSDKIVQGNTIFGVEGTATTGTGIDTSDATATADDIVMSKTAYAKGQKITGTMTQMDIPFSSLPDYGVDTSELTDGENFVQVNNDDTIVGVYAPMSLSVKANTYLPMRASNSDVAAAAGLTADKIVAGNTIFGIIGTGGTTEYESLNSIGTSVTSSSLLPESSFVTLSGTVNNTGIITEDITTFVAGEYYSVLANTIVITADKLVEGEIVLGIEGTGAGSGGGSGYETLNTVGTLTYQTEVLSGNTLALSGVVSDTGIVTENSTTFVAGSSFSDVATAIGLTSDQIVEGNTVLGVAGTAKIGADIGDYYDLDPSGSGGSSGLRIYQLIKTIPEIDTSSVTNTSSMFSGCFSLTTIPLLNTSSVTDMNNMFTSCSSLTTIPLLNTSDVTNMSSMFQNCSGLTTIPLLNTSSVTNMSYMFYGCSSLITIPSLDTSSATNVTFMFYACSDLTTIPSLNLSNMTSANSMFSSCSSLTNDSLNNILASLLTATSYTNRKTLAHIGLNKTQATTCITLSNWSACEAAGWTTGY